MLKEFREFALRGNMVDLAIGVIIGSAFGGLVNSIVTDLLMPIIAVITGGIDFTNLYVQLTGTPVVSDLAAARKAVTARCGQAWHSHRTSAQTGCPEDESRSS